NCAAGSGVLSPRPPACASPPRRTRAIRLSWRASVMGLRVGFAAGCVLLLAVAFQVPSWAGDPPPAPPGQGKAPDPVAFQTQVVSLLQRHCISCHGGDKPKANLSLDAFKDETAALKAPPVWANVPQNLRT